MNVNGAKAAKNNKRLFNVEKNYAPVTNRAKASMRNNLPASQDPESSPLKNSLMNNSFQAPKNNTMNSSFAAINVAPAPNVVGSITNAVGSVGKVASNTVGSVGKAAGNAVGSVGKVAGNAVTGLLDAFTGKPGATAPRLPGQMGGYSAPFAVSGNPSNANPYLAEYSVTTGGGNKNRSRKQKQMARSTRRASRRSRRASRKSRRVGGRRRNNNNNNVLVNEVNAVAVSPRRRSRRASRKSRRASRKSRRSRRASRRSRRASRRSRKVGGRRNRKNMRKSRRNNRKNRKNSRKSRRNNRKNHKNSRKSRRNNRRNNNMNMKVGGWW